MAVYISSDSWDGSSYSAANKAREDVELIVNSAGVPSFMMSPKCVSAVDQGAFKKIYKHLVNYREWKKLVSGLNAGDCLLLQFPVVCRTAFFSSVVRYAKSKRIKLVFLLHDVEAFRLMRRSDISLATKLTFEHEQNRSLPLADAIISHNPAMSECLVEEFGCNKDAIINLELFDYLFDGQKIDGQKSEFFADKSGPIVIAGNLRPHKAGYIYDLPADCSFYLYGVGLDESRIKSQKVEYKGRFNPDDGPSEIKGSWGLVWDGDSVESCSGPYGEYLRINNPHKASLYLAAGLPVIIWSQAALAPFVAKNNLGITVENLCDVKEAISALTDAQYEFMRKNADAMSKKLQAGYFTKHALAEAGRRVGCNELTDFDA